MDKRRKNNALFSKLSTFSDRSSMPSFDEIVKQDERNFQGIYREKLINITVETPEFLWYPIAKEISGRRKRRFIVYWSATAGVAILIASSLMIMDLSADRSPGHHARSLGESFDKNLSLNNDKVIRKKREDSPIGENNEVLLLSTERTLNQSKKENKKMVSTTDHSEDTSTKYQENSSNLSSSEKLDVGNTTYKLTSALISSIEVDSTELTPIHWDIFEDDRLPGKEENTLVLLANLAGSGASNYSVSNNALGLYSTDNSSALSEASVSDVSDSLVRKPPVSLGLDIRLPIGNRFYWNQGVQVSFQRNQYFSNGSMFEEKNTYLGIPLELLFVIKSWKKLSLYTHAGHLQEVLMLSSRDFSDGNNHSYKPYLLQLGVSGGLSVNYRFFKGLGVSVFTGVSKFYLTPTNSFYTDRSILPSLKISLGYTF